MRYLIFSMFLAGVVYGSTFPHATYLTLLVGMLVALVSESLAKRSN